MHDDIMIERLREAIRRESEIPPRQRFADLVKQGVIDEEGRVLLRRPEAPPVEKKKRKKKTKETP